MQTAEDRDYKLADYLARASDRYTLTKYKIVMSWLPKTPNLRVLNAGCGSGEMNILLSQNSTWQVDALDVDVEAIRLSQNLKLEHDITNLNIYHSTIEEYTATEKYDIIVSNDVLEHIEDDRAAMQKLSDLLKPNGLICISVPALQWLFGYHDEMLGHYRRYHRQELIDKLSVNFNLDKCRFFAASLIPVALLYSRALRQAYPIGELQQQSLTTRVLESVLDFECKVSLPIGISLIALASQKNSDRRD
ncbi:class I SAM-dependent methyltransferase [Iningainema tapete]|uniref:Class I SAM-dependent methyltransferase n=1 Tax=Iningainema tapete BLCC-T55 TaxID=2748662 RepID=A0A8J6XJA5_9CYAN|nr:class I SAM-dependent methyltransferase [Iningainema tapete]MBD2773877.1 class I SAM-dependent methyltransferase [Iningainema tapete BLCC-T55]